MTAYDRILKSLETAEGRQNFQQWSENEITKMVLAAAREIARPTPLPEGAVDPYACLYQHGRGVGANSVLDFLSSPLRFAKGGEKPRELFPDYGSKAILRSMRNES